MNTPNQLTKMYNDGFFDGYNKAKGVKTDQNNSRMYSDPYGDGYSDGYDKGYAEAKSEINPELEELKIKLADALQAQAFWRECYHIEHNKLIAEKTKKSCN